jgi:hypothetical protein
MGNWDLSYRVKEMAVIVPRLSRGHPQVGSDNEVASVTVVSKLCLFSVPVYVRIFHLLLLRRVFLSVPCSVRIN